MIGTRLKLISYKGIIHECLEDAPFVGALVIAVGCSNNCRGCHNQHLKVLETLNTSAEELILNVLKNPFNDGIILGGLEWSEDPEATIALIQEARRKGLKVMLYTGLAECNLYTRIGREYLDGCYVKFGGYQPSSAVKNYKCFGITLASSNQYIKYFE